MSEEVLLIIILDYIRIGLVVDTVLADQLELRP